MGGGRGGGGWHGIQPVRRVLGTHERFTPLGGSGVGEGETLPLDAECRGPGADPAPALVSSLVLADWAPWRAPGPPGSLGCSPVGE